MAILPNYSRCHFLQVFGGCFWPNWRESGFMGEQVLNKSTNSIVLPSHNDASLLTALSLGVNQDLYGREREGLAFDRGRFIGASR